MTKSSYAKKLLSVVLSLAMLLSCMVWTGVSAADATAYHYTFDDDDFADTSRASGYYRTNYWNQNSNAPKNVGNSGSYATLVEGGYNGSSHLMELRYESNGTNATSVTQQYAVFSLPNNTASAKDGRNTNQTMHLLANQAYKVTMTYKVSAYVSPMTLQLGIGMGNLSDSNGSKTSSRTTPALDLFAIDGATTDWVTKTTYVTVAAKEGAVILLDMADHTNRAGTVVQIGEIDITPVDEIPVLPDATYEFPIDDLTKENLIGNGSGKVVKTGAEYDHSGSATGKGMYMKMNEEYTSSGFRNAARFWLENANGYMMGNVGSKYVITAWVKSMISTTDDFYWAISSYSATNPNLDTAPRNYEETSFAASKVTLTPGVWTQVTATIDSFVGSGGSQHYMTFAAGFKSGKDTYNNQYVYVDDITIEEYLPDTPVELPPLAATTQPAGTLLGTQTFEQSTDIADYTVDVKADVRNPVIDTTVNYTADGSNSLAVELKKGTGNNGNASRPRFMVKLGDATTADNYAVEAGGSYNLSFWVRSSRKSTGFAFYVSTMTDPTQMLSFGSSSQGDPYRTIQVASSNLGTANAASTEFSKITLEANQWTQVVVTIPEVKAHGTDANAAQYLCIHYTDTGCYSDNADFTDRTFYMDDVSLYKVVDQWKVNYDTNGGDTLAPTVGDKNTQVTLAEPYKIGYTYTGWYTDPACTPESKVTSPYTLTAREVTLYTSWEKSEPDRVSLVQDFEDATDISDFVTNTQKPFVLSTDKNHTDGGTKALKTSVAYGWNGNFARPIWLFQMKDQDTPQQVVPGMPATVTFSLMASTDKSTVTLMLATVNDPSVVTRNPGSSADADSYRTMQVVSSCKANGANIGKLNAAKNEIGNISLKANEWTTITLEVPSIQGFKSGAQYLALVVGDSSAYKENTGFVGYDLYVDDIKLDTLVGGHTTNVTYNTMGGDAMEEGTGVVWADITAEATRAGYAFDGWFTDEACTTPITTYPPVESITLYAAWRPANAEVMDFEVDANYTPTVYADMELENSDVQGYYSGNTNMSKVAETYHDIVDDKAAPERGKVISVTVGNAANSNTKTYGVRLVGKDKTSSGFSLTKGTAYSVTFKYKVEALPVSSEIRVLEGSINWQGASPQENSRRDHNGLKITSADVGKGWKTGTINFESALGGVGVHLALVASDYTQRGGTVIYLDDIVVNSFQMTEFKTSVAATPVEDATKNHTKGGKSALKMDNSNINAMFEVARVVYASGVGEKRFATNTINTATAWLYSETDTRLVVGLFTEPDLTKMDELSDEQVVAVSDEIELKAGVWSRVQLEFALPSLAGEEETYVSLAVEARDNTVVYMDDVSIGTYSSDSSKVQTYEELAEGEHPNAPYFDGNLHGLNGNTVVSGKGYDGSDKSLEISMQGESEEDASRAVLFFDKMDATAAVNGGYIVTFYAMAEEDLDVTFGLGTSGTIDLSDLDMQATLHEAEATSKVSLTAGKWQGVSVFVSDLQGKNPELCTNPYLTLAAWFDGAAADNMKSVYIDNVSLRSYTGATPAKEEILCFENTDAFGFGKQLNLSEDGSMEVVLEQNRTTGGYYSLKVNTEGLGAISGATRPQFNLTNANGEAVRVEKGKNYRISFWVNIAEESLKTDLRYWLAVTEETESYTNETNQQRKDEQVHEASNWSGTKGEWKQITYTLTDAPRDGYIRLGISGTGGGEKTTFYLDDIRVTEYKVFELTGEETVQHYENYNLEDGKDFIRRGTGYVSDEANHTEGGSNSLRLQGVSNAGYNRNQMIIINPATQQPYEFKKGETYIMSFWLYCPEEYTDGFNLNTWIWGTDDVNLAFTQSNHKNDKNGTFEWDGGLAPDNEDSAYVAGEWNKYTLSFTATNGKYMLWGMTDGSRTDGNYVYYIDDIEITVPQPALVTFDANGGTFDEDRMALNDKGQYVESGFVGVLLEGPTVDPYLEGKKFSGWAYDKEGTKPFDIGADTVPSVQLTLYAIWGEWTNEDGYAQIDKTNKGDEEKDEVKYRTEIQYEKVWTGNAAIPVLEAGDRPELEDADPVTYIPNSNDDPVPTNDGLPVWLIIVIIVAAVVVVGGGAFLALLLLKNKKSDDEKEVNA